MGTEIPTRDEMLKRLDNYERVAIALKHLGAGELGDAERHVVAGLDALYAALASREQDTERLDWLEANARDVRGDDDAQVRVGFLEGHPGVPGAIQESGFYTQWWGENVYDDEGNPDWSKRFYTRGMFGDMRSAIDAAREPLIEGVTALSERVVSPGSETPRSGGRE